MKANSMEALLKQVLVWGSLAVLAIAVVASAIGFAVAGMPGLASALIGSGMALIFFSMTALSVLAGRRLSLGGFFGVVMGGWLFKLLAFIALVAGLRNAEFINGPVLFFTLVASIFVTLSIDALAAIRARIPLSSEIPPSV